MRPAALLFLLAASLAAQAAEVEGVVVDRESGRPLGGVHAQMTELATLVGPLYGAISDAAGRFSIAGLPAGVYRLVLRHRGYVFVKCGDRSGGIPKLALKAGQHMTDLKAELTRSAVIAGRVTDQSGDPVPDVLVFTERLPGRVSLPWQTGGAATTDDRGDYRMSVPPETLYVRAWPQWSGCQVPDEAAQVSRTYYPSAASQAAAVVLDATPGRELSGIDIRMIRQPLFSIGGVVRGRPNTPVALERGRAAGWYSGCMSGSTDSAGRFQFDRLVPGSYRVTVDSPGAQFFSGPVDLKAGGGDVANLVLAWGAGGELPGTLEMAAPAPGQQRPARMTVWLTPTDISGAYVNPLADVDAKGEFRLLHVGPGRFRVTVFGLPGNDYVDSVTLDGNAAPGGLLEVPRTIAGSKLRIVVKPNGAELSGRVMETSGDRLDSATVILADSLDLDRCETISAVVLPNRTYQFRHVRPGKYRVLAFVPREPIRLIRQDLILKLLAAAEEIDLKPGDRLTRNLTVVAGEDADAKPKR
jgi:hypothetical protein